LYSQNWRKHVDLPIKNTMNSELKTYIYKIYNPPQFHLSEFLLEKEGKTYYACQFKLNQFNIICRKAKTTPKKIGQFVTFWKRNNQGVTVPFSDNDPVDFYIIFVNNTNRLGQFIIPKSTLLTKGIISTKNKEGKRGFRVYPPWDTPTNKQAITTQKWQLKYYIETELNTTLSHLKKRFDIL